MLGFALLSIFIGCFVIPVIYIITKWISFLRIFQEPLGSNADGGIESELDQNALLRSHGYEIGDQIGQGTYADVKKAYSINNKKEVAIKIVNKRESGTGKNDRFLKREIEILKWLNHKNVIRVYDLIDGAHKFFIVMELAPKGDLLSLLQQCCKLGEDEAKVMFKSIVDGVLHCHRKGVTHRDLKLENILLSDDHQPIVTDFGFARYIGKIESQRARSRTFCGSYAYVAPEILQGIPYDGMASDVWSLGVVLYTMVCGRFPFDDSDPKQLLKETTSGKLEYPITAFCLSVQIKDLISKMLTANVRERITLNEAFDHPWLKNV
ncbi:hypothetical protein OS493_002431 [Desmophyllum pertusum]|uniref:Protein kinase domain-containing protein n=1 Tax=Desmophyllum pertusum TaxID=174260 RepID=A0A9X0CML6_9CNID|nr:hypothetical protein OS493_002431 [Desmophyllum pertusum]